MVFMHRLAAVVSIALLVAVPRVAAADDPPQGHAPLSQKEKLRWSVFMRDGKKLVEEEKWVSASMKFSEAIKLDPQPEAFLWKGFTQEKLGHLVVAKAIYAEARNQAKLEKLPQAVEQAEEALAEIRKKIPRVMVRLPAGVNATVSIDGATIVVPADGADLNPGLRSVDVSAPGRELFHAAMDAQEGKVYTLDAPLRPLTTEGEAPTPPVEGQRGCGPCSVGTAGEAPLPISLAALAALLLSERRRSRRQA